MRFSEHLIKAAERDALRLHTPGHKGKLSPLDLTELTDGSFPAKALDEAQKRAASAYNVKHARYLCGGSSQGVKAAVLYANAPAIVDVNSHRSVFDGFRLTGKKCITVGEKGGVRPITVKQIDEALTSDVKAVVVTSPTYYGFCADMQGIYDYCKKKGLLLIADGAHGAHFGFSELLPESPSKHCDICNVSTHKTLSALTQTALLLDDLPGGEHEKLDECANVTGSTSPSYLLYASIDYAVERAGSEFTRSAYAALYEPIADLKRAFPFLNNDDFTRPVLDCKRAGVSASALNDALIARGVFPEKTDDDRIVFIFTAENTPSDAERLKTAIAECVSELQ